MEKKIKIKMNSELVKISYETRLCQGIVPSGTGPMIISNGARYYKSTYATMKSVAHANTGMEENRNRRRGFTWPVFSPCSDSSGDGIHRVV